ncbi:MAG TPA: LLM class flavin-dependent oxidoreductase [Thermomicrobiales bacterium]|nr:LLM class flavin-dependent oxidoreductase [Thermomicrobiales bacterium]
MARNPWVAKAGAGVRWGVQLVLGETGLATLLERGRLIDSLGLDGVYIFDHPSLQADPWSCLSALAAVTGRVTLGSVVNCAGYRHPAMLARLAADVDNLSQGRLLLGVGIGWLEPEFRAFGVPFTPPADRYAALEEALAIVEGGWGPEKFSFTGEHYQVEGLRISPPPVQQPRPPLMIGGSGEQRTLRLVARYADACNISEAEPAAEGMDNAARAAIIRRKLDALRRHCAALDRPYDDILRSHFTLKLVIAASDAAADEKLDRLLASPSTSPATRRAPRSAFAVGGPQTIIRRYQALVDAGIQYFVVQVDSDDIETLELLAREAAPRVGYGA